MKMSQWPKWWLLGAVVVVLGLSLATAALVWIGIVICLVAAAMQVARVLSLLSNRK